MQTRAEQDRTTALRYCEALRRHLPFQFCTQAKSEERKFWMIPECDGFEVWWTDHIGGVEA